MNGCVHYASSASNSFSFNSHPVCTRTHTRNTLIRGGNPGGHNVINNGQRCPRKALCVPTVSLRRYRVKGGTLTIIARCPPTVRQSRCKRACTRCSKCRFRLSSPSPPGRLTRNRVNFPRSV